MQCGCSQGAKLGTSVQEWRSGVAGHGKHPTRLPLTAARVLGDMCRVSETWWWGWGGRVGCIPVPQIVIFSTPAPEGVRKAIDFPKLFYSQAAYSTKKLCVGKPEGRRAAELEDGELNFLMNLSLFSGTARMEPRGSQPGKGTEHPSRLLTGSQQLLCSE